MAEHLEGKLDESKSQPNNPVHNNEIFIIHGRNVAIRKELERFLRAIDIKPLEWDKARSLTKMPNPYTVVKIPVFRRPPSPFSGSA